ncbi:MAG: hypothetical protein AMJ45_05680 [Syntrophobacter sp. DG_60]|nr:MAG: hypothetical protein AMJ45_05680 [Syntrophobacter sp. DG_60]
MSGLYFIFPTLVIIAASFLVVKAATIALMMTGMDPKRARFQALSAFTGTGFTTREAELVITHPQRRHIIMILMILGNAGLVAVIATLLASFVKTKVYGLPIHVLLMGAGIYLIYRLATHKKLIRRWDKWIEDKLVRTKYIEDKPVDELLQLTEGYGVAEARVIEKSALMGKTLQGLSLSAKDILVLSIGRQGQWIPTPKGKEVIQKEDSLIMYGKLENIKQLFQ